MKKLTIIFCLSILISNLTFAGEVSKQNQNELAHFRPAGYERDLDFNRNILKIKPAAYLIGTINFSYEHFINEHQSFSISGKYNGVLRDKMMDTKLTINDSVVYSGSGLGSLTYWGFEAEYRVYLSKKSGPNGFYYGPYFRNNNFSLLFDDNISGPFAGQDRDVDGTFKLRTNITGAGLQCGFQWLLSNRLSVDWTILGLGLDVYHLNIKIHSDNLNQEIDQVIKDVTAGLDAMPLLTINRLKHKYRDDLLTFNYTTMNLGLRCGFKIGFAF